MARLLDTIRRWAAKPMRPGEGLHIDIFRASILLMEAGHDDATIFTFLRAAANTVTDRTVPDREIHGALSSARTRFNGGMIEGQKWPPYEARLREEIITQPGVITLEDLAVEGDRLPQESAFYLTKLYQPHDYLCVGVTSYNFTTKLLPEVLLHLKAQPHEYINPSPMTDEFGFTKDLDPVTGKKKLSAHSLDNTGPKTWQVVEFDHGTVAEHVALHWHLARSAPLALLVYSGGKSLHGWYNVRGWTDAAVSSFFGQAVQIGADPKMWSRCQFSRLPAGTNSKNGQTQMVLLFVPSHI